MRHENGKDKRGITADFDIFPVQADLAPADGLIWRSAWFDEGRDRKNAKYILRQHKEAAREKRKRSCQLKALYVLIMP